METLLETWWANIPAIGFLWFAASYKKPVKKYVYAAVAIMLGLWNAVTVSVTSYLLSALATLIIFTLMIFINAFTPRTVLAWTTAGFGLTLIPGWVGAGIGLLAATLVSVWRLKANKDYYKYLTYETVSALGVAPTSPGKIFEPDASRLPLPDVNPQKPSPSKINLLGYIAAGATAVTFVTATIIALFPLVSQ